MVIGLQHMIISFFDIIDFGHYIQLIFVMVIVVCKFAFIKILVHTFLDIGLDHTFNFHLYYYLYLFLP